MKYQKSISALAATTFALASLSATYAANMTTDVGGMTSGYDVQGMNVNEMTDNALDTDSMDDEGLSNSDLFEVSSPTVHQGDLTLSNVGEIDISDVLYVYGNMNVSNADTFKVTGKLRVTGKLTVSNGSLDATGGKVYFGKKSFSNGSFKGKQRKVPTVLTKLDPILRTDISEEEYAALLDTAKVAAKEYSALVKELVAVRKQKGDTAGVSEKILQNRTDFYNEAEQYVQEEDMGIFAKIEKADMAAANKKIKITLSTATR
jgi:hypothetical protein